MSRTDRVPATADRDAMISVHQHMAAPGAGDAVAYVSLQRVAACLRQPDPIEYWRSAPYPLSFLSRYKLRDKLIDALSKDQEHLVSLLGGHGLFLPDRLPSLNDLPNAHPGLGGQSGGGRSASPACAWPV